MSMQDICHRCKAQLAKQWKQQQDWERQEQEILNSSSLLMGEIRPWDYIRLMETHIRMLDADLDAKELIFASLHQVPLSGSDPMVLNTYLVVWKRQPPIDSEKLQEIESLESMSQNMSHKRGIL